MTGWAAVHGDGKGQEGEGEGEEGNGEHAWWLAKSGCHMWRVAPPDSSLDSVLTPEYRAVLTDT